MRNYDVVVIGAGMGGLSAATNLADKGFSVLLLERHNVPGGYATSFVRGRFEFEVSLHVLSDIGTRDRPANLGRYLDRLGVLDRLELVDVPTICRTVLPGVDLELPADRAGYEQVLCDRFPESARGIRRFLKRVLAVSEEADIFGRMPGLPLSQLVPRVAALPFRLRAIPRYLFTTLGEVLDRDVTDPAARAVLAQLWGYVGLPPSRASFLYYAATLGTFLRHGGWYPKGRSQALSHAFASVFRERGGVMRLGCGAQRILVSGGRVSGVVTDEGEEVRARAVVSNADVITTCRDLVGSENIPERFFRALRSSAVGPSIHMVYAGVAKSVEELGLESHEVMVSEDYDIDSHYGKAWTFDPPGHIIVASPNVIMPGISPPGTSVVTLSALAYGEPWMSVPPEDYVDRKNQLAESMFDMAEDIVPGLRGWVEVVEVGSPLTMMRYAGHVGGAVYGFENTAFAHTALRPGPVGPIPGLYFAGAWTSPGGGYAPVIGSGQTTGEMVAAKLGGLRAWR